MKNFTEEFEELYGMNNENFQNKLSNFRLLLNNIHDLKSFKQFDIYILRYILINYFSKEEIKNIAHNLEIIQHIIDYSIYADEKILFDFLIEIEVDVEILKPYFFSNLNKNKINETYFYFVTKTIYEIKYSFYKTIIPLSNDFHKLTRNNISNFILTNSSKKFICKFLKIYDHKIDNINIIKDNHLLTYENKINIRNIYYTKLGNEELELKEFNNVSDTELEEIYNNFYLIKNYKKIKIRVIYEVFKKFDKKYNINKSELFFGDYNIFKILIQKFITVTEKLHVLKNFVTVFGYADFEKIFPNPSDFDKKLNLLLEVLYISQSEYTKKKKSHIVEYFFLNILYFPLNIQIYIINYIFSVIFNYNKLGIGLKIYCLEDHVDMLNILKEYITYKKLAIIALVLFLNPFLSITLLNFVDYAFNKLGYKYHIDKIDIRKSETNSIIKKIGLERRCCIVNDNLEQHIPFFRYFVKEYYYKY